MASLKEKSVKGLFWDYAGRLSIQGVSFFVSIILSRILFPEDFGLLAMINVVVAVSTTFVDMGLSSALIQRKELTEEHFGTAFLLNISMGVLMSLILFLSSGKIAKFYNIDSLETIAKVMSIIFILNSFGNVIRAKLQKELNFKTLTISNLIAAVGSGTIGIISAISGFGVWSLVFQSISVPLIGNLSLFILEKWRPKMRFGITALKELWSFGFKMFLTSILENVFAQLDSLIIGKAMSASKLGYYYRAKSLQNIVYAHSSSSLLSVLFPVFSELQNDDERFKNVLYKSYNIVCFISFYLVGLLYLTANDIIIILFSERWTPSIILFKIMAMGGFIYPLVSLLMIVLSSRGNSKNYLILGIVKRLVLIPVYVSIFFVSLEQFLYINLVVSLVNFYINISFAAKEIGVRRSQFIKPLLPYLIITPAIVLSINILAGQVNTNIFLHVSGLILAFTLAYYVLNVLFRIKGLSLLISVTPEIKRYFNRIF